VSNYRRVSADLEAFVAKAFRVRGVRARRFYAGARRVSGYFRDAGRRRAMLSLPPTPIRIPDDRGYVIVPFGIFEETGAVVADARARIGRDLPNAAPRAKNRKRFLQNVIECSLLDLTSPLMRLALRDDLLATVSNYLGVPPLLSAISVFVSEPTDDGQRSSQLFHCDGDDVRQVKVFVLCSDVDETSGPLTLLDSEASSQVMAATKYRFRQRLSDAQVHAVVEAGREVSVLGPAGTTVCIDTSRCFHYGSRVAPGAPPRLVTMIQYQTPYSFMLPERSLQFRHLVNEELSSLQRLALGG